MAKIIGNNTRALKKGDPEPPLIPGRGRIYGMRFCPWSERVLLCAAAKGIEVEVVNINFCDKPEWYFNKHPQGKVPAFEKNGQIVIEFAVIPEFLDGVYPSHAILPTDPYLRAQQRILLEQTASLPPSFYGLCAIHRGDVVGEARDSIVKAMEDALDGAEKLLPDEYFGGSSAGYVDWMLFPFVERIALISSSLSLPSPFPSPRWPRLTAWWGRISAHPAAADAVQPAELLIEFSKTFISGKPDFDIGL